MNVIVFSKDRACQLDLLLRSMKRFWKEFLDIEIHVMYRYVDQSFKAGYDKLIALCPFKNVKWHKRYDFRVELLKYVNPSDQFTVFFPDDCVFKEPFSTACSQFDRFVVDKDVLCFSLRLSPRTTRCLMMGIDNDMPVFQYKGFQWQGLKGDFGYPMSVDGHIFRTSDLMPILRKYDYHNPSELEIAMCLEPPKRPFMQCLDLSPVMNLPLNQVQDMWINPHGNVTAQSLNEKFLNGQTIDLSRIEGYNNTGCHEIIPVYFK